MALSKLSPNSAFSIPRADDDEDGEAQILVAGSQFFITLANDIDYLDGKHAPFATVVEGQEEGQALDKINAAFTDNDNRPLRDIRIKHVIVLDDPFPDPDGLAPPSRTPSPTPEQLTSIRLDETDEVEDERTAEEKEEARRKADSSAAALTLEMVGDLPFAEIRPPENILFVCKLNPVTRSEDLELIFSRFGKILSCEVIRDKKSGDSLQYAFIEFDEKQSAEQAYFKMDSVLIDNQRIRVDFSQSVSKLHRRWVESRTQGRRKPRAPPVGHSYSMSPPPMQSSYSASRPHYNGRDARGQDLDRSFPDFNEYGGEGEAHQSRDAHRGDEKKSREASRRYDRYDAGDRDSCNPRHRDYDRELDNRHDGGRYERFRERRRRSCDRRYRERGRTERHSRSPQRNDREVRYREWNAHPRPY